MRNYLIVTLCTFVLLFSACSDKTTEPQSTEKQNYIVPLSVGNQWKYREVSVVKEGSSTTKKEKEYTLNVQSEEIINGAKEYNILNSLYDKIYMRWYNTAEGFWSNAFNINYREFSAKYPCKKGDTWVINTFTRRDEQENVLGEAEVRMTVVSTNVQHTVNGKNYTCYHYKESLNDIKTGEVVESAFRDYYYAVNIGLVQEIYTYNGIEDYRIELLSYILK